MVALLQEKIGKGPQRLGAYLDNRLLYKILNGQISDGLLSTDSSTRFYFITERTLSLNLVRIVAV